MPNLKLIISIINFLKEEWKKSEISEDTKESLEVAVQCLQTAYDIDNKDCEATENLLPFSLEEVFQVACLSHENDDGSNSSSLKSQKAEVMKNLGNNLMKSNQFAQAVKYYTAAIDLDSQNAIYYGNRAAAYSKLNDFENAIKDCEKAIEIDPKYAKAYGRMGLAYASLEQHDKAIKAFKEAISLDPDNESYQSNLKIAMEKNEKPSRNPTADLGGVAGLSGVDWQCLFTNPTFRDMASTILQDPNIINVMASSFNQASDSSQHASSGEGQGQGPGPDTNRGNGAGRNSLEVLMEAGQYLASQMAAANPDLVEQFRQTTSRVSRPNSDNKDSPLQ